MPDNLGEVAQTACQPVDLINNDRIDPSRSNIGEQAFQGRPLHFGARDAAIVNKVEAETVRHIYRRYAALGSVLALQVELDRHGIKSKVSVEKYGDSLETCALRSGVNRTTQKAK